MTSDGAVTRPKYVLERDSDLYHLAAPYNGKGVVGMRLFDFADAAAPAHFMTYEFPPGTGEGVHVHDIGAETGSYDEFYYIVEGSGVMMIDGEPVPVKAGDHVFIPLGPSRGIENTSDDVMKVFITWIDNPTGQR